MSYVIQAIYENGILRPLEKLALGEHQQVQITLAESPDIGSQAMVVPITTLEPEPFDLLRTIPVVVQPTDDGYMATFFDANIGITGDTKEESVANLKVLLVDIFEGLDNDEKQLGPDLVRQLAVLRSFMRRRA